MVQVKKLFVEVREQTRVAKHLGTSSSKKPLILQREAELRVGIAEEGLWELWLGGIQEAGGGSLTSLSLCFQDLTSDCSR